MLTGDEILNQIEEGNIVIKPFNKKDLSANSYYLHIADELVMYKEKELDCKKKNETITIKIPEEGYLLEPGKLYLSRTVEWTETDKYIPLLHGRLSLGTLGIMVHITAGFGDVGFKGTWTLEIVVVKPVRIYPNMKFCQICYLPAIGNDSIKYRGKYYGQIDTKSSEIQKDFE